MRNFILLIATIPVLSACAYALDTQNQEIMFLTPGADNAICYVYVEGLKYKVHPPEKAIVFKSRDPMEVQCDAPGNREQTLMVESKIAESGYYNLANGGIGLPWDHVSGALYEYPEIIEVNFIGVETKPFPPPAQNRPDIKQPEEYKLEEFLPSQPRLNADENAAPTEIRRRQTGSGFSEEQLFGTDSFSEETELPATGKGSLQSITSPYPGQ